MSVLVQKPCLFRSSLPFAFQTSASFAGSSPRREVFCRAIAAGVKTDGTAASKAKVRYRVSYFGGVTNLAPEEPRPSPTRSRGAMREVS